MLTSGKLLKRFHKESADLCGWWPRDDAPCRAVPFFFLARSGWGGILERTCPDCPCCVIGTLLQVSVTVAVWFPPRDESE